MTLRLVVLISGTGSNLKAICRAIDAGLCDASISAVISDKEHAAGLAFAQERGLTTRVVKIKSYADRAAWDQALADEVVSHKPELVVLAGFMKILGAPLLSQFPSRIINVHPALLPAFPGHDAPAQAIAARVRISGCTVHLVDGGVDTGPILAQAAVPVAVDDTIETLHTRIQRCEHALFPQVIDAIARGAITLTTPPTIAAEIAVGDTLLSPRLDRS